METSLNFTDAKTLYLCDKEGKILAQHKPFWTRFEQVKRIKENCNIVKEDDEGFQSNNKWKANIYCLDDNFNLRWTIKSPFKNDSFPNPIVWDKETVRKQ